MKIDIIFFQFTRTEFQALQQNCDMQYIFYPSHLFLPLRILNVYIRLSALAPVLLSMRPSGYTLGDSSGELESLRGLKNSPRERDHVSVGKGSFPFPSSSANLSDYINELDDAVKNGSYKEKDMMINKEENKGNVRGGVRGIENQIGLDCGRSRSDQGQGQGQSNEGPESDLSPEASFTVLQFYRSPIKYSLSLRTSFLICSTPLLSTPLYPIISYTILVYTILLYLYFSYSELSLHFTIDIFLIFHNLPFVISIFHQFKFLL